MDYEPGDHYRCLLMSDLHWDNPKCDRDRLKRDLDYAVREGLDIYLNGDTFCAMQGRYDGRRMKSDIREEHNTSTYLDDLVGTGIEWFLPYKDHIRLVGYGNHETSILKNCETDILGRWVEGLNSYGAEIVLVACGMCARACRDAMRRLNDKGIRAGLFRPIVLWPFSEKALMALSQKTKKFLTVEMNAGQMVEDVRLHTTHDADVHFYGRMGGGVPSPEEIVEKAEEILG